MDINLDAKQKTQLELIALYAGKTTGQVVAEAALFLLKHDVDSWEWMERHAALHSGEPFLGRDEMDARLAELLRRGAE
jgi:hypothetical protein